MWRHLGLFLVGVHLAGVAHAGDAVVTIDAAAASLPVPLAILGVHMGYTFLTADWKASAQRRFPACGWSDGALFRHFVANTPAREVERHGRMVTAARRDWWGHIQADDAARGGGEDAAYRWMQTDIWQDLELVERLHGENLIVTSGFPELSKETAAALVAFCNGDPGDPRTIGVDRLGTDWQTVGHWASIRARGDARHPAHPAPYHVRWWELGNELYDPRAGPKESWLTFPDYDNHAPGRNNVARAEAFLRGRGEHQGFLAYREAMKRVDPAIAVGAMLAPEHKAAWYVDWNQTILDEAHGQLDFVSVHPYPRSKGLPPERIVAQARDDVAVLTDAVRARLGACGFPAGFPLIASEWNAYEPSDPGLMQMQTALFAADVIGVLASRSATGECFYGAYDTIRADGSWAAMVRTAEAPRAGVPAGHRWPVYYAFALWKPLLGKRLAPAEVAGAPALAVWAGVADAGAAALIVNRSGEPVDARVVLRGRTAARYRVDQAAPADGHLEARDVLFDGMAMSSEPGERVDDLESLPPLSQGEAEGGGARCTLAPWSITVVELW
jgi:hypothetical protein